MKTLLGASGALAIALSAGLFSWWFSADQHFESAWKPEQKGAKLLFVGDMFFDRRIRQITEEKGEDFLFSCTDALFGSVDAVVGNLEGPITSNVSVSVGSVVGSPDNFRFTFPTTTAGALARHNVRIVGIGNNHIGNFGTEGIEETRALLKEAGVGYFGGLQGDETVYRTTIRGIDFSFVGFNAFGGDSTETVARRITAEKAEGRKVILFAHWGEEYTEDISALRPLAALFVESGAALIVGAHPHVVMPHETMDGVPVYYSLGNFFFDQYWEERVRQGLALRVTVSANGLGIEEIPVSIERDGTTCPSEDASF